MAWSILRGNILARTITQTLTPNPRPLSTGASQVTSRPINPFLKPPLSVPKEDSVKSLNTELPSTPLSPNPEAQIQMSNLEGPLTARSLAAEEEVVPLRSRLEDQINPSLRSRSKSVPCCHASEYKIDTLASYVISKIDESIKFGDPPLLYILGASSFLTMNATLRNFYKDYYELARLRIMALALHGLHKFPEVDPNEIFHSKIFHLSMTNADNESDIPKDEIVFRVLDVVQTHPKAGDHKVTEETHFYKDLGLDKWEFFDVIQALQMEFRLYIPNEIVTCKLAIEYIYDHRMERLPLEELEYYLEYTFQYGKSKSQYRTLVMLEPEPEAVPKCDEESAVDSTKSGF